MHTIFVTQLNMTEQKYELVKLSDLGWKATVIYEDEEPTNKCRIIYTDFMN